MINPKLLQTLEDRLNVLQAQLFGTCKTYDGKEDIYSLTEGYYGSFRRN